MLLAVSSAAWSATFGFIGVIIGAAVGFAGNWYQDRQQGKRDRIARMESLKDLHRGRQHQWQVELQDSLAEYMREVSRLFHHDKVAFRHQPTAGWGAVLMADDDDERMASLQRRCQVLKSRLDDESIRNMVSTYFSESVKLFSCGSEESAQTIYDNCAIMIDRILTSLGEAVRLSGGVSHQS